MVDEVMIKRMQACEKEVKNVLDRHGFELAFREMRLNGEIVKTQIVLVPKTRVVRPTPPANDTPK